ncbi:MAG: hypothetical protein P3W87_008660, partial [Gammaproteobacteria bacterium]|nr:hypothetical protein [Gammaproteobacteria bacterium]
TLSMWFHTTGEPTELQSALAYVQSSTGQSEVTRAIWEAIRAWCVFIVTIGFMMVFLIHNRATAGGRERGYDIWRAIWHILGGALTIQIFS